MNRDFAEILHELSAADADFQMGLPPSRIDILTEISGLTFDEAWPNRLTVESGALRYFVIGRKDLVLNKRASGRPKDMADADTLEPR